MNGTNKTIVGVVFGIALLYALACLALTVLQIADTEEVAMVVLWPHDVDGVVRWDLDLSEVPYLDEVVGWYASLVGFFGEGYVVDVVFTVLGFAVAVAGMFTRWSLDVKGTENPAEYLWTKRPRAARRGIFSPWGLIPAAWTRHKALAILPVVLLPFYILWSILITIALVIPYAVAAAVVAQRVRSAARKDAAAYSAASGSAVCPKCKREFVMPKVRCRCGLVLDYPVPNEYGYKTHSCNYGHKVPCRSNGRADLETVCPYCGESIATRESRPISFAMVGASGSGKTTMMLAAVATINAAARSKGVTAEAATPGISAGAVAAKDYAAKTASGELDSECLFLRSADMSGREIVFNDVSGSEFEPKEGRVLFEEYYNYCDGIVFAFDPVSLERGGRGARPMEVFETFHSTFCQITGSGPSSVSDVPMAVVATRRDVKGLADDDVRGFLEANGQGGFVKLAEAVFRDVRYFSVRSTGDECSTAAAPFWWVVSGSDPELARRVPLEP